MNLPSEISTPPPRNDGPARNLILRELLRAVPIVVFGGAGVLAAFFVAPLFLDGRAMELIVLRGTATAWLALSFYHLFHIWRWWLPGLNIFRLGTAAVGRVFEITFIQEGSGRRAREMKILRIKFRNAATQETTLIVGPVTTTTAPVQSNDEVHILYLQTESLGALYLPGLGVYPGRLE